VVRQQQDQAETFLLQALRAAGPQGLAAMPRLQWRDGLCWARPFLQHGRPALARLASLADLRFVEDPSNQDPQWARNRLRESIWPVLVEAFPEAEAVLARAAQRCAQALETLEEGVEADRARCVLRANEQGRRWRLNEAAWRELSPARRSQVLRWWWSSLGLAVPSSLVDRLAAEEWPPRLKPLPAAAREEGLLLQWTRAGTKRVQAWGGRLALRRAPAGAPGALMELPCTLLLRARRGDDQFQTKPGATVRSLKKQFQSRGVAAWDRMGPVVAQADGTLLWVPGLGWDARVPQVPGGWQLHWSADPTEQGAA
jgi:tRNA(Ile)-lysidine synthase